MSDSHAWSFVLSYHEWKLSFLQGTPLSKSKHWIERSLIWSHKATKIIIVILLDFFNRKWLKHCLQSKYKNASRSLLHVHQNPKLVEDIKKYFCADLKYTNQVKEDTEFFWVECGLSLNPHLIISLSMLLCLPCSNPASFLFLNIPSIFCFQGLCFLCPEASPSVLHG